MLRVSRVALGYQTIKNQVGCAAGQKYFVAKLGFTALLDNDVAMILAEGDNFFRNLNLLGMEHSPLGLADDLFQQADCPLQLDDKIQGGKHASKAAWRVSFQRRDCFPGIADGLVA